MDDALQVALADARGCLETDPDNDIRPGYLDAVFLALAAPGGVEPAEVICPDRHFAVEYNSGKHLLPIWEAKESSQLPHRYLLEAQKFVDGNFVINRAEETLEECQPEFEKFERRQGLHNHVAEIARDLLTIAIWWVRRPRRRLMCRDKALKLSDFEFDDWYTSSFASVIYSGGAESRKGANNIKRREFWDWWLATNVPTVDASRRRTSPCT